MLLYTKDDDFFAEPAREYLSRMGTVVCDDIAPIHRWVLKRFGGSARFT